MNPSPYQAASEHGLQSSTSNASQSIAASGGLVSEPIAATSERVIGQRRLSDQFAPAEDHAGLRGGQSSRREDDGAGAAGDAPSKLAQELNQFTEVAQRIRAGLVPAATFNERCQQAFDVANDLFGNAPTWVCFYRELMGGKGFLHTLFVNNQDFGAFLRTEQHHQIQLMLTALRSRDLPENDPRDPQRMITVRLPKSLHEAMCDEAERLNISVNRLCISRMLQLLDPEMIPETNSKPRGRKPRAHAKQA